MSSQVSHSTDEGGGMRSQSTQDEKGTGWRSGSQALASSRTEQISLKDLPPGPRTGTVTLVINTVQRHPISSRPADLKGPPTKERGKPPREHTRASRPLELLLARRAHTSLALSSGQQHGGLSHDHLPHAHTHGVSKQAPLTH